MNTQDDERLLDTIRAHYTPPEVDADRFDARLQARMQRPIRSSRPGWIWASLATAAAAAAVVFFAFDSAPTESPADPVPQIASVQPLSASAVPAEAVAADALPANTLLAELDVMDDLTADPFVDQLPDDYAELALLLEL